MNFKATREELEQANIDIDEKVVRVSGGGYVGVLSVYHEIHCLVRSPPLDLDINYYLYTHSRVGSTAEIDLEILLLPQHDD
jgi:hypothetical protein